MFRVRFTSLFLIFVSESFSLSHIFLSFYLFLCCPPGVQWPGGKIRRTPSMINRACTCTKCHQAVEPLCAGFTESWDKRPHLVVIDHIRGPKVCPILVLTINRGNTYMCPLSCRVPQRYSALDFPPYTNDKCLSI